MKHITNLENTYNKDAIQKYNTIVRDFIDFLKEENITELSDIFTYFNNKNYSKNKKHFTWQMFLI